MTTQGSEKLSQENNGCCLQRFVLKITYVFVKTLDIIALEKYTLGMAETEERISSAEDFKTSANRFSRASERFQYFDYENEVLEKWAQ